MGNKANPKCLRLGIIRDWDCNWFGTQNYSKMLLEDFKIRSYLKQELSRAVISQVNINRKEGILEILIKIARPGYIFGKNALDTGFIKDYLVKLTGANVQIKFSEEKDPDLSARLVAIWIAGQLERRIPFRRAMKMAIQRVLKSGALGVRVCCGGRLAGAEIARREWYKEGKVPLHTLRADIDYAFTEALTTYGKIGVKVWIYKGEIIKKKETNQITEQQDKDKDKDLVDLIDTLNSKNVKETKKGKKG